jgi:hypothetical protein
MEYRGNNYYVTGVNMDENSDKTYVKKFGSIRPFIRYVKTKKYFDDVNALHEVRKIMEKNGYTLGGYSAALIVKDGDWAHTFAVERKEDIKDYDNNLSYN